MWGRLPRCGAGPARRGSARHRSPSDPRHAERLLSKGEGKPTVRVVTLGCRLNAYESEVMRAHAAAAGLDDAVIVNTCAVTARGRAPGDADHPQAAAREPAARIIVTGCAAQIEPERFAAMPEVDHVDRQRREDAAPRRSAALGIADSPRVQVNDIMSVRETAHAIDRRLRQRARAPTCRCRTAAITAAPSASSPSAAGRRARCRPARWWRRCAGWSKRGCAEVVLTGVDITVLRRRPAGRR